MESMNGTDIQRIFAAQRSRALKLRASTAQDRIATLERLRAAIEAREDEVLAACFADFKKPEPEARLAELLHLDTDRVNLKATTTEGMGYIGREEGLACHAVVLMAAAGQE